MKAYPSDYICKPIHDEHRGKFFGYSGFGFPYMDCIGMVLPHTAYENEIRLHWKTVEGPTPVISGNENVPSSTMWAKCLTELVSSYMSLRTPNFDPKDLQQDYTMAQLASVVDKHIREDKSSLPVMPAALLTGAIRCAEPDVQESLCSANGLTKENTDQVKGEQWSDCLAPGCISIDDSLIRDDIGGVVVADNWFNEKAMPCSSIFSQWVPHAKTKYFVHHTPGLKGFINDLKRYVSAERDSLINDPYLGRPVFSHLRPLFICFAGTWLYEERQNSFDFVETDEKDWEEFTKLMSYFGSIVYMKIPDVSITGADSTNRKAIRAVDLRLMQEVTTLKGMVVNSEGYWRMLSCFRRKYKDGQFSPLSIGEGNNEGAGYVPMAWIWESWLFNAKRLILAQAIGRDAQLYLKDCDINIVLDDNPPDVVKGHHGDFGALKEAIVPGTIGSEEEQSRYRGVMEWYMNKLEKDGEDYRTDDEGEEDDPSRRGNETGGTALEHYGVVNVRSAFNTTETCSRCGETSSRCHWIRAGTVWQVKGDDKFWCDRCFTLQLTDMYEGNRSIAIKETAVIDAIVDRWVPTISAGRPSSSNLNVVQLISKPVQ